MSAAHEACSLPEVQKAFAELGRDLGLSRLALDDNQSLALVFDQHLVVEAQASLEMEALFFLAALSSFPELEEARKLGFMQQMLAAPLLRSEMGGSFFALDPESEEILLARITPLRGLTRTRLEAELEQFVSALDYWNNQVKGGFLHFDNAPAGALTPPSETGAVRI